jgi:5,5'-dehydrodivanillate O-demethylase
VTNAAATFVPTLSDEHFAQTAPELPAGRYLRQFWQPVYHSTDLVVGRPVPLRILNGGFTLYRGESGGTFLVGARCPHRGTQLSSAWVEGDALRCFYHGWKFEGGRCVEQPADESKSCDRVSLRTWPTREYLGFVFAFLGEGESPAFPLYPEFERFDGVVEIDSYLRRCNYFQNLENALDMSHVGFTHGDNSAAFDGIGLGRRLNAVESEWGITYTFTRADGELRVQQFGMPNIFYMTALPTDPEIGWQESLFWWVPIDDGQHMQFSLHRVPAVGAAAQRLIERRQQRRARIDIAHQEICEKILTGMLNIRDIDRDRVDLVRLQDDITQVGQGRIATRDAEFLGRSDIGLAVVRRLWRREIDALLEERPLKLWQRSTDIVPRSWGLSGAAARDVESPAEGDARSQLLDIRPQVELDIQLAGLNGADRRS